MLKQTAKFEIKKAEDRIYTLLLPEKCDAGELYDVLYQFSSYVIDLIRKGHEERKPVETKIEEKPDETPKVE